VPIESAPDAAQMAIGLAVTAASVSAAGQLRRASRSRTPASASTASAATPIRTNVGPWSLGVAIGVAAAAARLGDAAATGAGAAIVGDAVGANVGAGVVGTTVGSTAA